MSFLALDLPEELVDELTVVNEHFQTLIPD